MASIVGAMAAQSPMSVAASTARKMYMGWYNLRSAGMMINKMIFPKRATRRTAQTEIQSKTAHALVQEFQSKLRY